MVKITKIAAISSPFTWRVRMSNLTALGGLFRALANLHAYEEALAELKGANRPLQRFKPPPQGSFPIWINLPHRGSASGSRAGRVTTRSL
jgi:hypothetical protein